MSELPCDIPCHKCIAAYGITVHLPWIGDVPLNGTRMIVCPECGNKRCPKASDHENECTGSNKPGQEGSLY